MVGGRGKIKEDYWTFCRRRQRLSCLPTVHWRFSLPSLRSNLDLRPSEATHTGDERHAKPSLDELGKTLTDPKLTGGTFLIAGHTDAKGSDEYNLALSQRRAASVKAFLVETYKVDEGRLSVIGFGEEQLKNKENPLADESRRVQIVIRQGHRRRGQASRGGAGAGSRAKARGCPGRGRVRARRSAGARGGAAA